MTYQQPKPKQKVQLRELTLRQLGHMTADLSLAEKLLWLEALDRAGVSESVVWGIDDDAVDLVVQAREAGIGVAISYFSKVFFPEELKRVYARASQSGASHVALVGRGSSFALDVMGWTEQQMLDACVTATHQAVEQGLHVSIGLAYSTQTRVPYLVEVAGAVAEAGASIFHITDSLGVASPQLMHQLVTVVKQEVSIPIEVHCHNDYGLATANAIASVQAGAEIVETVVNGQDPERSSIAAMDEVAVALEHLYGVETGIRLELLTGLSRLHEQMTGARIAENKPIVGRRAFNYRVASGEATSEARRDDFYGSELVVTFDPRSVGNERFFVIGKFSGPNEVTARLRQLGETVDEDLLPLLVRLVHDHASGERRAIGDDELRFLLGVARNAQTPAFA